MILAKKYKYYYQFVYFYLCKGPVPHILAKAKHEVAIDKMVCFCNLWFWNKKFCLPPERGSLIKTPMKITVLWMEDRPGLATHRGRSDPLPWGVWRCPVIATTRSWQRTRTSEAGTRKGKRHPCLVTSKSHSRHFAEHTGRGQFHRD